MKKIFMALVVIAISSPFAAWAMFKPIRVLLPSWVDGVSCIDENICLDDKNNYQKAVTLYESARKEVSKSVGPFENPPTVTFCSKESCFRAFGFNEASASTVGKSGIVLGPRGWKPHVIRHEMIHHRQAEVIGPMTMFLKPEWLIEGMAYSLSNDPRTPLAERWEKSRVQFDSWFRQVGEGKLWESARKL